VNHTHQKRKPKKRKEKKGNYINEKMKKKLISFLGVFFVKKKVYQH